MFKITEELLFKILILIAFVSYFYLSLQFPSIPMQEGYGAGLFPIIISVSFFYNLIAFTGAKFFKIYFTGMTISMTNSIEK